MIQVGVTIHGTGSGIVVADQDDDGALVTGIESLPFDVDVVADRVRAVAGENPAAQVVVDGDGLGEALWTILFPDTRTFRGGPAARARLRDGSPRAWRYTDRGIERQRLVNVLVVAMNQRRIHFAAGLAGMEAMTNALVSYRREVKEDGLVGPELVVALCLAVLPRKVKRSGRLGMLA